MSVQPPALPPPTVSFQFHDATRRHRRTSADVTSAAFGKQELTGRISVAAGAGTSMESQRIIVLETNASAGSSADFLREFQPLGVLRGAFSGTSLRLAPSDEAADSVQVPLKRQPMVEDVVLTAPPAPHLTANVEQAFRYAREERFEDGNDSSFSRSLASLIQQYGAAAVAGIERLIMSPLTPAGVSAEATRTLAQVEHASTRDQRRAVLLKALVHVSPEVRDRATLGLASSGDGSVLPFLRAAIHREAVPELRADMELLVSQMQSD
jgi:hypothetical protein